MGTVLSVEVSRAGRVLVQHRFDTDIHRVIKIGRLSSADIKLEDSKASRVHAIIELGSGGNPSLTDMGSTAGTFVNGKRVHRVRLAQSDQITVGDTVLVVDLGARAVDVAPSQLAMPGGAMKTPCAAPAKILGQLPVSQWGPQGPATLTGPQRVELAGQGLAPPAVSMPVAPAPTVPAFDVNVGAVPAAERRVTQGELSDAAVESRSHFALPPEAELNDDNRVLEMRVYWGRVLLAMHHYVKPKRISIGETKTTDVFISSEGLPVEEFPLVRYLDDEYVLSFCSGMEGEVQIGGELRTLNSIRDTDWAFKDAGLEATHQITMPVDARALVHWGGATFALRFVPPPTPVLSSVKQTLDLAYANSLVLSFCAHVAAVATLLVYTHDAKALPADLFKKHVEVICRFLPPPEVNKSTTRRLDRIRSATKRKQSKTPDPPKPTRKPGLQQVSQARIPSGVANARTQQRHAEQIRKQFQKLLSGSEGWGRTSDGRNEGSLFGALGDVIGTVGKGALRESFDTLRARGRGRVIGDGPSRSRSIDAIDTLGRLGNGSPSYGSVRGGLGPREERQVVSLRTPEVVGALPPELIKQVINQNKNQLRYCYERELQRNQSLEGRVVMRWFIEQGGNVAHVLVRDSTLGDPTVEECLASRIRTWRFPRPAGGGVVEVNYPFFFKAS